MSEDERSEGVLRPPKAQDREPEPAPQARTPLPRRESPRVPVRVISESKGAVLVEWESSGQPQRGFVPKATLVGGTAGEDVLRAALPYGLKWKDFIKLNIRPADVEAALRRRGIWTLADLHARYADAKQAVWELVAFNVADLIRQAEEANK